VKNKGGSMEKFYNIDMQEILKNFEIDCKIIY